MKKLKCAAQVFTGLLILAGPVHATNLSGGVLLGYNGGVGFQLNGMVSDFARGFPLNLQLALAYASMDPGNALDARRIFINNATNGDPEKSGHRWDFRLDFLYPVNWLSMQRAYLLGGVRYTSFTGNFKFVGGNEDFDITSNQWGFGLGVKAYFPMSNRFDFVLSTGLDYFLSGDLTGHDTTYNPDGEHVNPREDYSYDNADDAVNQPGLEFRFLVGVDYRF